MDTIAFTNQKGGVGKTTTTLAIAHDLGRRGLRVLLLDADPQANATSVVGIDGTARLSTADVLLDPQRHVLGDALVEVPDWHLTLAPAEIGLANKERSRWAADEHTLRDAVASVAPDFDFALIDCPPSLGILTLNALTAADRLVIVTQPSFFSLQGLRALLDTQELVQRYYNPGLDFSGVVVNLVARTSEHQDRILELQRYFGFDLVLEPHVRKRTVIEEAAGKRVPLTSLGSYKDADRAAHEFHRLADRLLDQSRAQPAAPETAPSAPPSVSPPGDRPAWPPISTPGSTAQHTRW